MTGLEALAACSYEPSEPPLEQPGICKGPPILPRMERALSRRVVDVRAMSKLTVISNCLSPWTLTAKASNDHGTAYIVVKGSSDSHTSSR